MKLKLLVICIIVLFPSLVWAACSGSSPTWTTTPDYTSVNTCVGNASAGDTINVSNGSATWNSTLVITKRINLIGGNGGTTTITYGSIGGGSEQFLIRYDTADHESTAAFRLSGFTFDLNSTGPWLGIGENYKAAPFTIQDNIRIDHNTVINGGDNNAIWNYCNYYGVVDNNSFSGFSFYPFKNDSQETEFGYYANSPQNIFVSGSNNYLYFEDNTIALTGSDNLVWESQYSARYVARYNTITGVAGVVFEAHGHQGEGGMGAVFGVEGYGNRITQTQYALASLRGGRSFIFNNSVVTGAGDVENQGHDSAVDCPSSYATEMMIHDTYFWGSRENYTGTLIPSVVGGSVSCGGLTNRPTLGRDVIAQDSTPGVSCGTLANLPGTCTVGQGYWATSQSCSDLTGMVGVNPATPISGTLYKCTATNTWTPFYTPYTYPHPLRGATDETAPTATWAIDSTGLIATGTFSESVNATTKTGVSFTGSVTGAITATYKDGMAGAIVRYDLNKEVQQADTVVVDYTTPGDGIKDLAGNALADISDGAVTNGSTQNSPPLVTLTIGAHVGATVNVYPGINCGSTCGPVEYETGAVLTLSVQALRNYTGCTIAGTGCGASTTMSEARTCTVTCTKISPDVVIGAGSAVTLGTGAVGTLY